MSFLDRLHTAETILADGAMGTMLQAAGLPLANLPAAVGPSRSAGKDLSRQGGE
jgi:methionine synthase I (cobalamin-dependent)